MMYLMDSNVISELRKPGETQSAAKVDSNVLAWSKSVDAESLFVSVISILELETGTLAMERRDPRQGAVLRTWMQKRVMQAFAGHILPIDTEIALRCAALPVPNPRPRRDSLIAATALVHGMTVVTRNVRDFEGTGAQILSPWRA